MPRFSIVVPAFNAAATIAETLRSLQAQSFTDFEVVIIDDGSTDTTSAVAAPFLADSRFRYIRQANRGLAGARNSGIHAARAALIGFCDSDDLWAPSKLAAHAAHFDSDATLGLSFAGSALIDMESRPVGISQRPRLTGITPAHILKRNPVGNGSAAVMRRAALEEIAFRQPANSSRICYFDERFRQSEDIECWLRFALTTDWKIEGVAGDLTLYRVAPGGLSASTEKQLASWENVIAKLRPLAPEFFASHEGAARAYQLRYLARRAVAARDGRAARHYLRRALTASPEPFLHEPGKSLTTVAAALALAIPGIDPLRFTRRAA
ncbi:glycosyltransferase family 2 protein [Pseudoruegeria sp. SHC-113]|uniref:glycosyltransferase family 2 protein n=1 Tax=Pseudoruegeria sp. SHC-113 TaxID=2855439 RepID=UPI0021BAB813|nr:glycosyltransferase family 2 protein [Pseudoruegeria sp. SHC-113]MCT8160088.1 glycosyltransferase family 2 protein [Pseudoruegeria sp. SHC-113]